MIELGLGWIDQGVAKVVGQRRPELDRPAERGAHEEPHSDDLGVEIDILRLEPLLAREGKELRVELRSPFRGGADQLDAFLIARIAQAG